jgi:hypothetical protein
MTAEQYRATAKKIIDEQTTMINQRVAILLEEIIGPKIEETIKINPYTNDITFLMSEIVTGNYGERVSFLSVLIERLHNLGFTTKELEGDYVDERPRFYISWEELNTYNR